MKKFLVALMLCMVSIVSFGQLNAQKIEDYAGYKTVFKLPMGYGEIRYLNEQGFVYLGVTDNQFEKSMASIFLGDDKQCAIATLNDLSNLKNTIGKETLVVLGANRKTTKLFKSVVGELVFETDGVAGVSHALFITNWNKAITAIEEFKTE